MTVNMGCTNATPNQSLSLLMIILVFMSAMRSRSLLAMGSTISTSATLMWGTSCTRVRHHGVYAFFSPWEAMDVVATFR